MAIGRALSPFARIAISEELSVFFAYEPGICADGIQNSLAHLVRADRDFFKLISSASPRETHLANAGTISAT